MSLFEDLQKVEPLHSELRKYLRTTVIGRMVHHPFCVDYIPDLERCNLINRRYEQKKKMAEDFLKDKKWENFVFIHDRPYRLDGLLKICNEVDRKTLSELTASVWTDAEGLSINKKVWKMLFARCSQPDLMDESEKEKFAALPETVTVYRGIDTKKNVHGLSWTTEKSVAIWFANRFRKKGQDAWLIEGQVKRSKIIAFLEQREESEVICLSKDVRNKKESIVPERK